MSYDFILIDCHLLGYRSWWPVRDLHTLDGTPTGLEFGFIKNVLACARNWQPGKVVLAWDGRPERCNTIFPRFTDETGKEVGYKSNRQKHEDKESEPAWTPRFEVLRRAFLPLLTTVYDPCTEADEQIARFVAKAEREGKRTIIISKDRDMHQLISDNTHLVMGGDELDVITPALVENQWGVPPSKVTLRRAIEGDSSDGITGIPRIPKDIIIKLAKDSSSLDDMIHRIRHGKYCKSDSQLTKLLNGEAVIRRNFALSELASQASYPPTFCEGTLGDSTQIMQLCKRLELNSLLARREWELFSEGV
jgi:DNA polymerase-1